MTNHAAMLARAGRHAEALTYSEEAVALRRELVDMNQDAYLPDLAISLGNVGYISLMAKQTSDSAIAATTEAVELLHGLSKSDPQAFGSNLRTATQILIQLHRLAGNKVEADRLTLSLRQSED